MVVRDDEPVEAALDAVVRVFDQLAEGRKLIQTRASHIKRQMAAGQPLKEIVEGEEQPLIVQTVRDCTTALLEAFSRFQRAEAKALYAEGMSMERIAKLFGITRQRVAHFIQSANS